MDLGDTEAGQHNAEGPPAFRVARRGYDRDEVDTYFSQLAARLREAVDQFARTEQARAELEGEVTRLRERSPSFEQVGGEAAALLQEAGRSAEQLVENGRRRAETIIEKAQQQAEQIRADVTNEAQKVLEQAREVAEQIRREVEQERAAVAERDRRGARVPRWAVGRPGSGPRRDQRSAGADPQATGPGARLPPTQRRRPHRTPAPRHRPSPQWWPRPSRSPSRLRAAAKAISDLVALPCTLARPGFMQLVGSGIGKELLRLASAVADGALNVRARAVPSPRSSRPGPRPLVWPTGSCSCPDSRARQTVRRSHPGDDRSGSEKPPRWRLASMRVVPTTTRRGGNPQ